MEKKKEEENKRDNTVIKAVEYPDPVITARYPTITKVCTHQELDPAELKSSLNKKIAKMRK